MKKRIRIDNRCLDKFKQLADKYAPFLKYVFIMAYTNHTQYDITFADVEDFVLLSNELGFQRVVLLFDKK